MADSVAYKLKKQTRSSVLHDYKIIFLFFKKIQAFFYHVNIRIFLKYARSTKYPSLISCLGQGIALSYLL